MPKIVDKEERRRQILEGAARVFAQSGYYGARVEDVAQAVGISKGLVYEYFASKEELFLQVCRDLVPWEEVDASAFSTDAQGLVALIAEIAGRYEQSQDFFLILSDFWSTVTRGTAGQRKIFLDQGEAFYAVPRALFRDLIARGQESGAFHRGPDAATLASVLIAGIEGIRLQHVLDARHANRELAMTDLARMVVRDLTGDADAADYADLSPPAQAGAA